MDKKVVLENNTLLAEFMDESGEFTKKRVRAGCIESLHYHNSWDWLMPVVQKIVPPHGWPLSGLKHQSDLIRVLSSGNINKVYLSVVEFIKYYNKI